MMTYNREVEGIVFTKDKNPVFFITGKWNEEIMYAPINNAEMTCTNFVTVFKEDTVYDEARQKMYF